jgi:epoxyqueuosine reductase
VTLDRGVPGLVTARRARHSLFVTASAEREAIVKAGRQLGFTSPRFARLEPLERDAFYEQWLAEGRAGDMRFLLHHRKARLDPRSRYPWARTIVSAFVPYLPPPPPEVNWRESLRGRIAAYAFGHDYHDVLGDRLEGWAAAIREIAPGCLVKSFVDTGAVFEHEWAARAGVGWTGKHTLTLSEEGSYAFLAELLLSVEIDPDQPVQDRCGTCERCLDACPTGAIEPGYRLDPRRCISYLTIEHRGTIPADLRPLLGEWVFGCDLCQVACPWNGGAARRPNEELAPDLRTLLLLDEPRYLARYGRSAVRRTGRIGLARNSAVVLGNTGNPEAISALAVALRTHDAPLVRGHAAWAIGRLVPGADRSSRAELLRALADPDAGVRHEARAALDSLD